MDLNAILQQARHFQERLTEIQERLGERQVSAAVGGGMVEVVMDGALRVRSVRIDPEVIDASDPAMLEDLVLAAVNEAIGRARAMGQEELRSLTGGLQIPGMI